MCDSCEAGDDYAEGYPVGEEVEGGVGRDGVKKKRVRCGYKGSDVFVTRL